MNSGDKRLPVNDTRRSNIGKMAENLHWPGIGPGSLAWEARILPLNHQCLLELKSQFRERGAGAPEAKKKPLPKVS